MRALLLVLSLLVPVQSLDDAVRSAVQGGRTPSMDRVMKVASDAGKPVVVFGILLAIAGFDPTLGPPTARIALAALLGTNLAVESVKRVTFRARPDGEHKRSNAAFPSSHAANAFALATILARRWRRWAPVFLALATTVAFSRIYLDRHWLSDVIVGSALGVFCAWAAVRWLWGWAERRPRVAKMPHAAPDAGP
jgi:membrane-associated phospholipid phosphatase